MKSLNKTLAALTALALSAINSLCAQETFNGLGTDLGNLYRTSPAKTRSISAENPAGEPGKGGSAIDGTGKNASRDLGQGWKISPSVTIKAGQTFTVADIEGH